MTHFLKLRNLRGLQKRLIHTTSQTPNRIKVEECEGLRKITMDEPKTRNALSMQMMDDLIKAIEENKSDKHLRSIMITSTGTIFCAGHNLKELTAENGIEKQRLIFAKCNQLMLSIRKSEVPVFAVCNGLAAAAGCQLVAACDFAIASDTSKFSTPGANFGVFCTTPGIAVARSINRSLAAYMVLTGLPLTAQEALQAGLVAKVFPANALEASVKEIHTNIASKSRPIIQHGKEFFYKQIEMTYERALKEGADAMVANLQYEDSQEGLNSFKEKRKPVWQHLEKIIKTE